jgi:hypothetical protein
VAREPDDQLSNPFDSRRRAPLVTRWVLVVLLFSVPAGVIAGVNGAGKWELFAIIVGPVLVLLLLQSFARPFDAEHTDRGMLEAAVISQGVAAKQFVMAMAALLVAVAIAIGATWTKAAWICSPIGVAISVLLRRHRGRSGFFAAFAFAAIPLAVYGLFVGGLLLLVRN